MGRRGEEGKVRRKGEEEEGLTQKFWRGVPYGLWPLDGGGAVAISVRDTVVL